VKEYEAPTSYYPKGRTWPPKFFGHAGRTGVKGAFHDASERGSRTGGIQSKGAWTDPATGVEYPTYWMRSLIPAELGRDFMTAIENWYGVNLNEIDSFANKGNR